MPYIKSDRRKFEKNLERVVKYYIDCSGDLSFAITVLMGAYVEKHGLCYQNIHDAVNTALDAASEFKRNVEFPYEDLAILANGDVDSISRLKKLIAEKTINLK